uniref:Uncharacterized protein n=1 Tax=Panagrolaimus sp. PS1159 TaxID=55785 RepID=A0AC35G3K6_9BILA
MKILTEHEVHLCDTNGDVIEEWSVKQCISFYIEYDGKEYVMGGGRWYKRDYHKELKEYHKQRLTSIFFGAKQKLGNTSTFDFGKNALILVHIKMDESSDIFDVEPNVFKLEPTSDGLFIKKQASIDLNGNDIGFKNSVLMGKKSANVIISHDDASKKRDFQNILKPSKVFEIKEHYSILSLML